jgi:hypothetical protein
MCGQHSNRLESCVKKILNSNQGNSMLYGLTKETGLRLAATALMVAVLNACGGGGAGSDCTRLDATRSSALPSCTSSSTGTESSATTTTAATIQLLVSNQQINSAGAAPVDVTVISRDANGQAISGRAVQFTVTDPDNTAYASNFSQTTGTTHSTGANGQLTATLSTGSSKANRTITLTAKVDGASAAIPVTVTGTTLAVSGTNAMVFGASAKLNAVLTDSSGKPISSVPLQVTSSAGNTVALGNPSTDANGKAVVTFTGTRAGTDTLTVSGGGASSSYSITVSSNGFAFATPQPDTVTGIGEELPISVRWTDNGQPVVNKMVSFAATRGTFVAPSPIATDSNGVATTRLKSASAGPSIVTASGPAGSGVAGSINVAFESRLPAANLDLQADKTTVSINPPGISGNVATLTAVVRDASNNRLANRVVNFRIEQDPSQGALSTASAITDSNGIAKSQYVPSGQSSPTNGVVIIAQVVDTLVQSRPLRLTVASQNLFVRIGTDNAVETDSPNYIKKYAAFVTDAAGNPVPNATVQFLIRPRQDEAYDPDISADAFQRRTTGDYAYYKGIYIWRDPFWVQINEAGGSPIGCYNEDVNFNGIIFDAGEDFNKNGMLDTGNSYSVNTSAVTNNAGFALASITYPKDRANWTGVTLKATAQVSGTEATVTASFVLPAASADLNKDNVSPPGLRSPYGTGPNCQTPG